MAYEYLDTWMMTYRSGINEYSLNGKVRTKANDGNIAKHMIKVNSI